MEHWRVPYLGLREIPTGLDEFELTTFFSYGAAELRFISSRRQSLHRFALALHIGFVRMSGRTLDAFEQIPKKLWTHIAGQLHEAAPEIGTLRSLYAGRARTLADHQKLAYEALGFQRITEHQRRYVVRWLREMLTGRAAFTTLIPELKRWFYDHRILLIGERELRTFIANAVRDRETQLLADLTTAFATQKLMTWSKALTSLRDDGRALQSWLIAPPLKQSSVQMRGLFERIKHLLEMGADAHWPDAVNDVMVRHLGLRCANRPPTVSKRITQDRRLLEAACFVRYALCTASDQLLLMLRRWIKSMTNKAKSKTAPRASESQAMLREFGGAVRMLADDTALSDGQLRSELLVLVDQTLETAAPNHTTPGMGNRTISSIPGTTQRTNHTKECKAFRTSCSPNRACRLDRQVQFS